MKSQRTGEAKLASKKERVSSGESQVRTPGYGPLFRKRDHNNENWKQYLLVSFKKIKNVLFIEL